MRDDFLPAQIQANGLTLPLQGAERDADVADWEALRSCTDLSATPPPA